MPISDADKPPICSPTPVLTAQASRDDEFDAPLRDVGSRTVTDESIDWAPGTAVHWTFLTIATVVVVASLSLTVQNREQVIVPFVNAPLPGTCTFRGVTGLPCPGCGLTRSFISMGHGQLRDAWSFNPAGLLFFAIVVFQIPYRIYQILRICRGQGEHRFARFDNWVLVALVIALLVQWVYALAARAM